MKANSSLSLQWIAGDQTKPDQFPYLDLSLARSSMAIVEVSQVIRSIQSIPSTESPS